MTRPLYPTPRNVQAYEQYGAAKGSVLMVWRILRCNPWGGSGYDPVRWPPVGLGLIFDHEGAAELVTAAGSVAFAYLAYSMALEVADIFS